MHRALHVGTRLMALATVGFVSIGTEVRCSEASARPSLSSLQTQIDEILVRLGIVEDEVLPAVGCPAQQPVRGPGTITSFAVDIPGCADASKNIREIAIDELNIDIRETTTGLDVEYRTYAPGTPHFGSAKFTSAVTLGGSKELQAWFDAAAALPPGDDGSSVRKNITVTLFKSDKTPGRGYNLFDCFPIGYAPLARDACSGEQRDEVSVACSNVELLSTAPDPAVPPDPVVAGFSVEIMNAGGKEVDTAWESVSGGELIIELTETTIGSDQFATTSPGHKSVGEIILRGAMTDKRAALTQWINDTVQGKEWRKDLTITEILSDGSAGRSQTCFDGFPVRYVFPRMSVTNTTGNVMEEVRIKPIRCELK